MMIEQPKAENGPKKEPTQGWKAKAACLALALLLALVGAKSYFNAKGLHEEIAAQEAELSKLDAELSKYGGAHVGTQAEADSQGDAAADADPAAAFLKKLLTWDSYDGYKDVREWLENECGADKKGQALTEFMPKAKEEAFGDANMQFKEAKVYTLSEKGGATSCFALCKVENRTDGNTGMGKVGVYFTIDKENRISGVSAYALAK